MRHIISVLVENEAGALSRLVGLFSQRGYNIETLNVAPTEDPTLSRLTLTTYGDDHKIEQITKQLNKLVEVVKVVDLSEGAHIERELMLIKVKARVLHVLKLNELRTFSVRKLLMSPQRLTPFKSRVRLKKLMVLLMHSQKTPS